MASKYLQKYQVPEGFYDILHEFSREILRAQPEDILDYAANYFEHKCQGKEYYYESKSNIQRTGDEAKKYAPTPAANFAGQAQKVVATSNKNEPVAAVAAAAAGVAQNENRVPSQHSVKPSNSNRIPSAGDASSRPRTQNSIKSDLSHPDEKRITKEFVGDLYSSALNKAQKPSSAERSNEEVKSNPSPANKSNEGSREGNRTRGSNQAIESQNSNKLSAQEIPAETPGQDENEETQQEQEVLQGEEQVEQDRNQDEQQLEDTQNADAQEERQEADVQEEGKEEAGTQEEGQEAYAQEGGQEEVVQEGEQEAVAQEEGQEAVAQEEGEEADAQQIEGQENFETPQEEQQRNNNEEQDEQEVALRQRDEENVVLDGPVEEYENVAVKIQSVFRGSQARKATKKL